MSSFLKFIQQFHFFLLFVLLEVISISVVINSYTSKKNKFIGSANIVTGYFHQKVTDVTDYVSLKEENQKLTVENTRFRNVSKSFFKENYVSRKLIKDSIYNQQYFHIAAKVINNSTHKQHNYITLDRGIKHGIKEDMVVISTEGVVGIVTSVSRNFSLVMSMLNINFGLSAKFKKNDYYGSVVWDGENYTTAILKDIPNHVEVAVGDTVITSGYSALFPKGIPIGIISDFYQKPGVSFYDIHVVLSVDFKKLHNVYVVGNFLRKEQLDLEKRVSELE